MPDGSTIGFAPDEIDPTPPHPIRPPEVGDRRQRRPAPGRAVNAAVCVAAATSGAVTGLLGDDAVDADGTAHPGLPWAGCSVLAADPATLRTIRAKAAASGTCHVADMPAAAQHTRVYADHLATVKETQAEDMEYYAVSLIGPRNRIDTIAGRLPLPA